MKSKFSRKKNHRTKRKNKSLQFESLEPRQMLTFFTPGVSDPALFDAVISVSGDASGGVFEDLGSRDETTQVNLTDGGRIGADEFDDGPLQLRILDAESNITGGNIGNNVEFSNAEVNLSGGVVGDNLDIFNFSSVVNVSGGTIGDRLDLFTGTLNQSGGEIGDRFIARSTINISGGTIGSNLRLFGSDLADISGGVIGRGDGTFQISNSTVNISGGVINDRLNVNSDSVVNLFVLEYQLDGQSQESQVTGEAVTISDRDVTISGVLADGTSFSYGLFTGGFQGDVFTSESTLNVTLVDQTGIPNEPAIITGDLAAAARSDGFNFSISGDVDVSDTDGLNEFTPQIITRGEFGDFSINPSGGWTYEIDVAAVGTVFIGDFVSESFEITAVDGTTESVTITIDGTELPTPSQDSTITGDFSRSGLATDSTITGVVSVTDPDVGPIQVLDSTTGTVTNFGQSISTNFFVGLQFEVTSRTRIDEVGAFFRVFNPTGEATTVFAAINRLTSLSDRPDSSDLTGSDLIFKTEFSVSENLAVTLAPVTELTLDPGFYSLSFGLDENPDSASLSLPSFVEAGVPNRSLFGFRQSDGSSFTSSGNARLIINGELDPLNVSEVVPQSGIQGTYGVFNIDAIGNWNYVIDTAAVESLVLGEAVTEDFEIVSVDGTATETITVTVNGVNQAVTASDTTLEVFEDAVNGSTVGTVVASDPDGDAPVITIVSGNEAGVFAVDAVGNVTLADASQLDFDITPEYTLVFEASDGLTTDTATLVIGVIDVNQAAVISGDIAGTTTEDATSPLTGQINVVDPDAEESESIPSQQSGNYGVFEINAAGEYSYTVDNDAVAALNSTESVTDTFEVVSFDGTATASVTITIEGRNDHFDDAVTTNFGTPVTFNVFDNDQVAGDVVITSNGSAQGGDILIGADGNVTYTPSEGANLNGTDSFQLTFEDENGNISRSNVTVTINPFVESGDMSGFELVNVNDFFNPDSGSGGFIVTYEFTVSEDSIIDGELFAWGIRSGYSGGGEIADVFLGGFNGAASRGPGSFDISNIDSGFRPELTVGDSFRVSFRINGAAFDSVDFALTFVDSDPQRVSTSASQVAISTAPTNDWGAGFVQNVSISNVSESAISGWSVILDVPEGDTFDLSNVWGATAETLANGDILFSGLSWNRDISADGSINFGFLGDNATMDAVVIDELDFALI